MTFWLHEQRIEAAHEILRESGARTVLDLGCGDGDLLTRLAGEPQIERIVGIDLCRASLCRLHARLDALDGEETARVNLVDGSIICGACSPKPCAWHSGLH